MFRQLLIVMKCR